MLDYKLNNMIKAQDLRVGNLISYNDNAYAVRRITDFDRVCLGDNNLVADLQNCLPILIMPELLESAGFERNDYIYRKHAICGATFFIEQTGDSFRSVMDANYPEFVDCSEPFKYLHQLQNLYYFSVFEELEIKAITPSASQTQ